MRNDNDNPYAATTSTASLTDGERQKLEQLDSMPMMSAQMVTLALVGGLCFYGYSCFSMINRNDLNYDFGQTALFGLLAAAIAVVVSVFLPRLVTRLKSNMLLQDSDIPFDQKALQVFTIQMIFGLAAIEAAAFYNIFCFQRTQSYISLGIAIALIALMLSRFPTRQSIKSWLFGILRSKESGQ
jgi:hypothetical protein